MISPEKISQKPPPLTGEKTAAAAFTIWQNHLANDLGISEEELRRRRYQFLTEGVHFEKKGTRKLYSAAGEQKIRETLHIPLLEPSEKTAGANTSLEQPRNGAAIPAQNASFPSAAKKPAMLLTQGAVGVTKVMVWRAWPQIANKHIVEAYAPGTDPSDRRNILRVRVSDNKHFTRGLEVPVRLIAAPDLYECTRRAPRFRGRW